MRRPLVADENSMWWLHCDENDMPEIPINPNETKFRHGRNQGETRKRRFAATNRRNTATILRFVRVEGEKARAEATHERDSWETNRQTEEHAMGGVYIDRQEKEKERGGGEGEGVAFITRVPPSHR